jgi:hypothetical protein
VPYTSFASATPIMSWASPPYPCSGPKMIRGRLWSLSSTELMCSSRLVTEAGMREEREASVGEAFVEGRVGFEAVGSGAHAMHPTRFRRASHRASPRKK